MDDFRVDLDPGLDMKVHKMPELSTNALEVAKKVAEVAISNAPVVTGNYRSGITAEKFTGGARVFAADQKSSWVEFGIPSRGQSAHWVLRTAAESLGLKFKKGHG